MIQDPSRYENIPCSMANEKEMQHQNPRGEEVESQAQLRWITNAKRRALQPIICTHRFM